MSDRYRDRKFCMVLYPEDSTHVEVLAMLQQGYQYIGILHDKDTWLEDDTDDTSLVGTQKKPHYHIVIKFPQARWNTAVASELGLAPNYLQKCVSYQGSVLYLVHFGLPAKYQYDVNEVFGTLIKDLKKFMCQGDETSRVRQIFDFIDSSEYINYEDVFKWCLEHDLYGDLRRMGSGVMTLIGIHNDRIGRQFPTDVNRNNAMFHGFVQGYHAASKGGLSGFDDEY